MRVRESTPAREQTTERGFFNWCIITRPPCRERIGSRRRSEAKDGSSVSYLPVKEQLILFQHSAAPCPWLVLPLEDPTKEPLPRHGRDPPQLPSCPVTMCNGNATNK